MTAEGGLSRKDCRISRYRLDVALWYVVSMFEVDLIMFLRRMSEVVRGR